MRQARRLYAGAPSPCGRRAPIPVPVASAIWRTPLPLTPMPATLTVKSTTDM